MKTIKSFPIIGVVGPCTAGKSTLIRNLERHKIPARHIAQEHSFVEDMWQRLTHPDVLIFLDVSYPVSLKRRQFNWTESEYLEQQRRLRHARAHCHFYLLTDSYTEEEVFQLVYEFLKKHFPLLIPSQ